MEVRRGELGDISSVLWLLNVMQTEAEKNQIDWFKVSHTLIECIRQGLVLICLNKEGQAVGSIGGATTSEWYSQELLLGDYWFFVVILAVLLYLLATCLTHSYRVFGIIDE